MYIYQLPYEVNKEMCRLLDNDDDWRELAGVYMKYSPFDITDIENVARRRGTSPTYELFVRWGQLNHRVEELFILLYRMKHKPALWCLKQLVDEKFQKLLSKADIGNGGRGKITDTDDADKQESSQGVNVERDIPRPVMLIEQAVQTPISDSAKNTPSTADMRSSVGSPADCDIMKSVKAIPTITYEELKEATGHWDERNLLGTGGFGQVFKGEWKQLPVAIKRLKNEKNIRNKELIGELCLNQYRHDNILPLYGYSLGGPETCLVYQLMSGGSLESRLKCRPPHKPLSWCERYKIAHGSARGLLFLHTMAGEPLIHGDIKPANILLDHCTVPKIGDFGLARRGPYGKDKTHMKVSNIHGTEAYLPHQYLTSRQLSTAVDVFSFGVVLAELATALPPKRQGDFLYDRIHEMAHRGDDLAQYEDVILRSSPDSNPDLCRKFIRLALACTNYRRHDRPNMLEVFKQIERLDVPGKDLPY